VKDQEQLAGHQAPSDPAGPAPRQSLVESVKTAQGRVVDELSELRNRLELARPRSRTVDSAFLVVARDSETGGGVLAAALAFRVFMFMVPYVFVVIVLFDVAAGLADEDPHSVAKSAGIGGLMAQAVSASAKHLNGSSRYLAFLAGLVLVFLAAKAMLKTLRIVHGLVWRVRVTKIARPGRAVLVLMVLVTISLLSSMVVDRLRKASGIGGLGATVLYTVLPSGVWLLLEYAMPHAPHVGWKDLLPGAIMFGVATLALHLFTVYWVAHLIKRRSATYGAIGAALALLLWAYVFGRIMTASAVLNASMWARAHPPPDPARERGAAEPAGTPGARIDVDQVMGRLSGPDVAEQ
jgi:uncharacterized BrkB/YihY/UPF0761 family membrane protein